MSGRAKEAAVHVGGRVRHLCVDNNTLCVVEEQTGENLLKGANVGLRVLRALCYGALLSGARKHGERVRFTIEDVGEWMDEYPELQERALGLLTAANPEETPADPPQVQEETSRPAIAAV